MHFKNILFDLDGTLIDSRPGIQFAATIAIKLILPERKAIDLQDKIGPPIQQIFQKEFADLDPKVFCELIAAFRFFYDNYAWRMADIYAGVLETLQSLIKLAARNFVVTNKPIGATVNILKQFNMIACFTEVVSPDIKKPNFCSKSEMVAYLIKSYKLDPGVTVMIGDSSEDAHAARLCNLPFIPVAFGYSDYFKSYQLPNQKILNNYSDLIGLLK